MKWVTLSAIVIAFGLLTGNDEEMEAEKQRLLERAEEIIEKSQTLEMSMVEARRAVQILLQELESWAEAHDVELTTRTRTHFMPATDQDELLTADRCSLFYEVDLEELCPLDLAKSEVWGGSMLFCRYRCAP